LGNLLFEALKTPGSNPGWSIFKMSKELIKTFKKIEFKVLPQDFLIIKIPLNQYKKIKNNFHSMIFEKEGVTLVILKNNWNKTKSNFKNYKIERGYKIITYNTSTDLNLVGFLAIISKIMADKGISLNVISAYYRDYFLIKKSKVELAIKELNKINKIKR